MRIAGGYAVNHNAAVVLPQVLRVVNSQPGIVLEGLARWVVVVNLQHVIFLPAREWNSDVRR